MPGKKKNKNKRALLLLRVYQTGRRARGVETPKIWAGAARFFDESDNDSTPPTAMRDNRSGTISPLPSHCSAKMTTDKHIGLHAMKGRIQLI